MNLQEYRKFKCMSVRQVSKELGVSRQHIYDIEKREAFPSRKLCIKINEWSGGLVTQGELLFPDQMMLVHDNFVTTERWEENGGQDRKRSVNHARIKGNETYAGIC